MDDLPAGPPADRTPAPTADGPSAEPAPEAPANSPFAVPTSPAPRASTPSAFAPASSAPPGPPTAYASPETALPASVRPGVDHALDPRSISADRLRRFLFIGVMAALSLPVVIGMMIGGAAPMWAPAPWLVAVALLAARAWWWPAVRYRHISYRIDSKVLVIRRGVWWRSVAMVPRSRVQHTDVSQGPVERHFDLGTLVVHTAGTQFAAVPLSGLAHGTAAAIRDLLIDESDVDDAV